MIRYYRKDKNELLVLTGAVYSFVAYLTAFTLEVLFIIDLAKRNSQLMATTASTTSASSTSQLYNPDVSDQTTFDQARLALETMQTHITVSCLAISILYFIVFIGSLILIISLILQSAFFLLIWMCLMTTMYLPEFGLIIYVSLYGWGLDTRNGQTELIFYLFRAALNVIFIMRAYKLYREWNYDKNFFMMKASGSNHHRFSSAGYDSPYFISGANNDSLTTTINPVFSSSTLNLNHHDHIRDFNYYNSNDNNHSPFTTSSSRINQRIINSSNSQAGKNRFNQTVSTLDSSAFENADGKFKFFSPSNHRHHQQQQPSELTPNYRNSALRPHSALSIDDNDSIGEYEMDLDYRTLTQQRHYNRQQNDQQQQVALGRRQEVAANNKGSPNNSIGLSYSTQSLDRRHLRDMDFTIPEQVILRPLGHQPFDYLSRPGGGSTTNLNQQSSPFGNTQLQPPSYQSNTRKQQHQQAKILTSKTNIYNERF